MPERALDGVTVLELGSSIATAYAGKLIADLGASVILVEPPDGHPLRKAGPTREGASHTGLFAHLATNKQSFVFDPLAAASTLALLAQDADIILADGTTAAEHALGARIPQHTIVVDVSPFGRYGRYSSWKSSDIALWALGGFMYFSGEKSREPLHLPGAQAEFHAGMHAALAALAGLHDQRRSGLGQRVEISAVEATLAAHNWLTTFWSHGGRTQDRTTQDLIRCADGWVSFMQLVRYPNLFILIDQPELMDDPRWETAAGWAMHNPTIYGMVADWCSTRTRREIVEAAQELRIASQPVLDVSDLAASAHLVERLWWLDVEDQALGPIRLPGFPYKFSETPPAICAPAPTLGQHTASLGEGAASHTPRDAPATGLASNYGPLHGVRVVEVTNNWAGPVCGRHLGDLGADVIKVESPTRPATRGGIWPNNDPQSQPHNRSGYFNEMNRNKRDVVLDLAAPAGKAAFLELVKDCDIVVENNSARVMPNLGLGYQALKAVNPRVIMISISASGSSGPERDYVAYGSNIEASCGLASLLGYDDSEPYRTSSYYADPLAGGHAAIAALAACEYRRRTGEGQWIDISLNEVAPNFFPAALIGYQLNGTIPRRIGNRDPEHAPQGAYRCAGMDNWVAISVQSDAEWRALSRVIGREDLAANPALATADGRRAAHNDIDAAINAWTWPREQPTVAATLQQAGVSAAPVLASWQFLSDPHLHERGFWVDVEQPLVGVHKYTGWPWKFSRTPAAVYRPAPLFGEHNHAILREAGLSDADIAALYDAQVTADHPIPL